MALSLRKKLYAIEKKELPDQIVAPAPVRVACTTIQKNNPLTIALPRQISAEFFSYLGVSEMGDVDLEKILFIDTETTGLSRGVGTLAFLIGAGHVRQGQFVVKQYLMEDYLQEKNMLETFLNDFSAFDMIISFNGKSYDLPLLQSRLIINKLSPLDLTLPHGDILYPSRRTWRLRLKQCSLKHLEENILAIRRQGDLPGALIPQQYFNFIKSKNFYLLEDILDHNHQDIASLFLLFQTLYGIYTQPQQQNFIEDLFSTAKQLEKQGELHRARQCYHLSASGKFKGPANIHLGQSFQREKEFDQAIFHYEKMIAENQGGLSPFIQLSKIYEHQKKDIHLALHYAEKGLLKASDLLYFSPTAVQDEKNDLQYRYMRLLRKKEKLLFLQSKP